MGKSMQILKYSALIALWGMSAAAATKAEIEKDCSMKNKTISISVKGGKSFRATLADNSSSRALIKLLEKSDITIEMQDYANMEKVGPLGSRLPRNDEQIETSCGDLILYQGKYFAIYYAPNSWNLTRLGKIENVAEAELKEALGEGGARVTLSIDK